MAAAATAAKAIAALEATSSSSFRSAVVGVVCELVVVVVVLPLLLFDDPVLRSDVGAPASVRVALVASVVATTEDYNRKLWVDCNNWGGTSICYTRSTTKLPVVDGVSVDGCGGRAVLLCILAAGSFASEASSSSISK